MNTENFDAYAKQKQFDNEIVREYRMYEDWARKVDLPVYQLCILYELLANKKLTQKQLIMVTNFPKQTINKGVLNLKQAGYVVFEEVKLDHRQKMIILTKNGYAYAVKKIGPLFKLEATVFEKLGPKKSKQLLELLRLYGDIFEQETKKYWKTKMDQKGEYK